MGSCERVGGGKNGPRKSSMFYALVLGVCVCVCVLRCCVFVVLSSFSVAANRFHFVAHVPRNGQLLPLVFMV